VAQRKRGRPPDPQTPAEWQEAVDLAGWLRMLCDCAMYGLLTGSLFEPLKDRAHRHWFGKINLPRCDYILAKGKERGVVPADTDTLIRRYLPATADAESAFDAAVEAAVPKGARAK
jgi:hypothetical protein